MATSENKSKVLAGELERSIVLIMIRIFPADKQNARRVVVPRTVVFLFRLCFASGTRGKLYQLERIPDVKADEF